MKQTEQERGAITRTSEKMAFAQPLPTLLLLDIKLSGHTTPQTGVGELPPP